MSPNTSCGSLTERLLRQNADLTGHVSQLTEEKNDLRNLVMKLEEQIRWYQQTAGRDYVRLFLYGHILEVVQSDSFCYLVSVFTPDNVEILSIWFLVESLEIFIGVIVIIIAVLYWKPSLCQIWGFIHSEPLFLCPALMWKNWSQCSQAKVNLTTKPDSMEQQQTPVKEMFKFKFCPCQLYISYYVHNASGKCHLFQFVL